VSDPRSGLAATTVEAGRSILMALPPAFIMLVAMNIAFLWLVFDFMSHENDHRLSIVNKVIDQCLNK
jgi:hypothetical protein